MKRFKQLSLFMLNYSLKCVTGLYVAATRSDGYVMLLLVCEFTEYWDENECVTVCYTFLEKCYGFGF